MTQQELLFMRREAKAPKKAKKAKTMDAAIAEKTEGMARVEENAEANDPTFPDRAYNAMLNYLKVKGPATGEDLTDHCLATGIVPHNDHAFGPVVLRLKRNGLIQAIGMQPRRKGDAAPGATVWSLKNEN